MIQDACGRGTRGLIFKSVFCGHHNNCMVPLNIFKYF